MTTLEFLALRKRELQRQLRSFCDGLILLGSNNLKSLYKERFPGATDFPSAEHMLREILTEIVESAFPDRLFSE